MKNLIRFISCIVILITILINPCFSRGSQRNGLPIAKKRDYEAKAMIFHDVRPRHHLQELLAPHNSNLPVHHASKEEIVDHIVRGLQKRKLNPREMEEQIRRANEHGLDEIHKQILIRNEQKENARKLLQDMRQTRQQSKKQQETMRQQFPIKGLTKNNQPSQNQPQRPYSPRQLVQNQQGGQTRTYLQRQAASIQQNYQPAQSQQLRFQPPAQRPAERLQNLRQPAPIQQNYDLQLAQSRQLQHQSSPLERPVGRLQIKMKEVQSQTSQNQESQRLNQGQQRQSFSQLQQNQIQSQLPPRTQPSSGQLSQAQQSQRQLSQNRQVLDPSSQVKQSESQRLTQGQRQPNLIKPQIYLQTLQSQSLQSQPSSGQLSMVQQPQRQLSQTRQSMDQTFAPKVKQSDRNPLYQNVAGQREPSRQAPDASSQSLPQQPQPYPYQVQPPRQPNNNNNNGPKQQNSSNPKRPRRCIREKRSLEAESGNDAGKACVYIDGENSDGSDE